MVQSFQMQLASVKYLAWQACIESIKGGKKKKGAWISSLGASNYLVLKV